MYRVSIYMYIYVRIIDGGERHLLMSILGNKAWNFSEFCHASHTTNLSLFYFYVCFGYMELFFLYSGYMELFFVYLGYMELNFSVPIILLRVFWVHGTFWEILPCEPAEVVHIMFIILMFLHTYNMGHCIWNFL
jgi:hypothetical protein